MNNFFIYAKTLLPRAETIPTSFNLRERTRKHKTLKVTVKQFLGVVLRFKKPSTYKEKGRPVHHFSLKINGERLMKVMQ